MKKSFSIHDLNISYIFAWIGFAFYVLVFGIVALLALVRFPELVNQLATMISTKHQVLISQNVSTFVVLLIGVGMGYTSPLIRHILGQLPIAFPAMLMFSLTGLGLGIAVTMIHRGLAAGDHSFDWYVYSVFGFLVIYRLVYCWMFWRFRIVERLSR